MLEYLSVQKLLPALDRRYLTTADGNYVLRRGKICYYWEGYSQFTLRAGIIPLFVAFTRDQYNRVCGLDAKGQQYTYAAEGWIVSPHSQSLQQYFSDVY